MHGPGPTGALHEPSAPLYVVESSHADATQTGEAGVGGRGGDGGNGGGNGADGGCGGGDSNDETGHRFVTEVGLASTDRKSTRLNSSH